MAFFLEAAARARRARRREALIDTRMTRAKGDDFSDYLETLEDPEDE